jgi:hypothetical protein
MKKGIIKTNYGLLTDVSKSVNELFGDTTDRSVSLRTAQGFKRMFNCKSMDDDAAEFIVHSGMVVAYNQLNSKDKNNNGTGALLALGLFLCYQNGK